MAAATSIWPRWPRSAWISGSSGAVEPMIASVDRLAVSTVASASRHAVNSPASAQAVENWVPLMSPRPSFGPSTTGVSPAFSSAVRPGMRVPS